MDSVPNSTTFKEELISILLKLTQEIEMERTLPNALYQSHYYSHSKT
jgi:hypothetical protein